MSISVAFGCPFEGAVAPERVLGLAEEAITLGADEVVFADTIGVATPTQVRQLVLEAVKFARPVGVHLHNTRSTGFANAWAALEWGASIFDASVGGIGGCPFAPRATGNVATEDLVYLLHGRGRRHGDRPGRADRRRRLARERSRPGAPRPGVPRGVVRARAG